MKNSIRYSIALAGLAAIAACGRGADYNISEGFGPDPVLPEEEKRLIPIVNIAPAERWGDGEMPVAADGMTVTEFATGLQHPRWVYTLPNGDVLVAESNAPARPEHDDGIRNWIMGKVMAKAGAGVPSADRISILRDADGDGIAETNQVFLTGLKSPFGMALVDDTLYVANTDAIVAFPYAEGALRVTAPGETVTSLPAGDYNHHWTKNIIPSEDGSKLYATVGSNSNVAEKGMAMEEGRAAIWEVDLASGAKRLFATGLRNPNGMDWNPANGELWTAVNERDELGNNLVPDYATSVQDGAFYGWPWAYWGDNVDERVEPMRPEMVERSIAPDYALGSHTASLGLVFAPEDQALGSRFADGMFIGQHGSWNRKPRVGYKVVFIPFRGGEPAGDPVDVLTGFVIDDEARGRPAGVDFGSDGSLLVADDVGNTIWRVTGEG